jgi:hypothetical protein
VQAEKKEKTTARSSSFYFAHASQNKKSLPFPTTTQQNAGKKPTIFQCICLN